MQITQQPLINPLQFYRNLTSQRLASLVRLVSSITLHTVKALV